MVFDFVCLKVWVRNVIVVKKINVIVVDAWLWVEIPDSQYLRIYTSSRQPHCNTLLANSHLFIISLLTLSLLYLLVIKIIIRYRLKLKS